MAIITGSNRACVTIAAAVALAAAASVDGLSVQPLNHNRLLGASSSGAVGSSSRNTFMTQQQPHHLRKSKRTTQLSMGVTRSNDSSNRNVRGRVRSAVSNISNKIRGGRSGSKRELFQQKFVTLAMAFSALFFISTGRHTDLFANQEGGAAGSSAASSATSVVARGGSATAAPSKPSSILNSIISRASHTKSDAPISPVDRTIFNSWDELRGGGSKKAASTATGVEEMAVQTRKTFKDAVSDLNDYMKGAKSDTLFLLAATALITPLCKMAGTSPILGFLASGMLLGPNGFGVISGIHTTETLAELGIVFFLFEMGIELSVERLKSMKKDVFGLGLSQYTVTAVVLGMAAKIFGGLSGPASVVVGGALSLSSSAFVLQLIKDKKELATRFGKASFGVLLLQDLAVVPLLVSFP